MMNIAVKSNEMTSPGDLDSLPEVHQLEQRNGKAALGGGLGMPLYQSSHLKYSIVCFLSCSASSAFSVMVTGMHVCRSNT